MKTITAAFAALMMSATIGNAAEPAKVMEGAAGKVYANSGGMTLYTFDKDAEGKSVCNGDCAAKWPPLMADAAAVAEGEWSVVTRDDGSKMWAYDGKPVYTFVNDKAAGDTTGDGVGGVWHILKAQ